MALPPPSPDSTCVVTGASSGIGAELARELARRGYGVTLVARREERLRELAGQLGPNAEVEPCDVADAEARRGLVDRLAERGREVAVLVNNAGFSTSGRFARGERERELAMVRTNVEAVVDFCALLLPGMVDRGSGAILNLASTASFQPLPGQAGYAASKAFILSFSESLHTELHGSGVTVTALCPGPVRTEFTEVAGLAETESLPGFLWSDAPEIAQAGIEGLESGRRVVIPGALNRAGAIGGHLVPRSLFLPIASRVYPAARK
jgi:short-subunit dehydrogenase